MCSENNCHLQYTSDQNDPFSPQGAFKFHQRTGKKKICLLQVTVCITAASQTQVKNGSQDELSRSFETLFFKSSSISNFFRAFGASKDSNWIHFLPLGLGEL